MSSHQDPTIHQTPTNGKPEIGHVLFLDIVGFTKLSRAEQVAVLAQPSVALQVRSIPGTPVQLAGVGASVNASVTGAAQLSPAVAEPV